MKESLEVEPINTGIDAPRTTSASKDLQKSEQQNKS